MRGWVSDSDQLVCAAVLRVFFSVYNNRVWTRVLLVVLK